MKYLTFIALAVLVSSCMSFQPVTFTESEAVTHVYTDLDDSKDLLYTKAHDWMITTFHNAESVIEHDDKEQGIIIGKYLLFGDIHRTGYGYSATEIDTRVHAKIDIQVKDNKARIILLPIGTWQYDPNQMTIYKYSKQRAIDDMEALAEEFHAYIQKKREDF